MKIQIDQFSHEENNARRNNFQSHFHMLYEMCSDLRHKSLNVITSTHIHYHILAFVHDFSLKKKLYKYRLIFGSLAALIFRELKICGWNLFAVAQSQCRKRKGKRRNSLRDRWARWFGSVFDIQSKNENHIECRSDSYLFSSVRSRYFLFREQLEW